MFLAANKESLEISKKSEAGVLLDFIKFENNVEEFNLSGFNSPKLCFVIYYLNGRKQFKRHTVIVLIYYLVTSAKYRRVIFNQELEVRYKIRFLEIGVDKDHVHFLLQSIPMYSPTKIIQIIKSITSKKMFKKYPNLKEKLWGSEFWSKGYFMSTAGKHGDERKLRNYVKNQGSGKHSYKAFQQKQLKLFE